MLSEYRPISYMPGFEINRQGDVRNSKTGRIQKQRLRVNGITRWVQCYGADGISRSSDISALLDETFGRGAAVAAGLPAPDWYKVRRGRENGKRQRERHQANSLFARRCTTCGRPTTQYRCRRCWCKLRGDDADGGDEPDTYRNHAPDFAL